MRIPFRALPSSITKFKPSLMLPRNTTIIATMMDVAVSIALIATTGTLTVASITIGEDVNTPPAQDAAGKFISSTTLDGAINATCVLRARRALAPATTSIGLMVWRMHQTLKNCRQSTMLSARIQCTSFHRLYQSDCMNVPLICCTASQGLGSACCRSKSQRPIGQSTLQATLRYPTLVALL